MLSFNDKLIKIYTSFTSICPRLDNSISKHLFVIASVQLKYLFESDGLHIMMFISMLAI